MKKILIIRFSSIGDIVLTSPVIRCLKLQKGFEIHYLTKLEYVILLESNPYIDKVYAFNNNFIVNVCYIHHMFDVVSCEQQNFF